MTDTRRATLCVEAEPHPGDRALIHAWLDRWQGQLSSCSENLGCGCCVDLFDVEAPAAAFDELPSRVFAASAWADPLAVTCREGVPATPNLSIKTPTAMNRIDAQFARLSAVGRKALIPFFTAGDPSLEATVPVMQALVASGADVIELGVPFSDPMADGPTIQRSSERALGRGAGMTYVLDAVRQFRDGDDRTPVVLMGYLNPIDIRGAATFAAQAQDAGVDGVLLVDLPPEEAGEFREAFAAHGIALVLLASPTTTETRLAALCAQAQGYLYYVSFAGVTGASDRLDTVQASTRLRQLRHASAAPVVAGFGIRDAASAAAMAVDADGVVVGSALVAALDGAVDADDAAARARALLTPLRAALDGPR